MHDNVMNLSAGKVLVGSASHLEVLAEEHHFECCVSAMPNFNHLEAKVLPNSVNEALQGRH